MANQSIGLTQTQQLKQTMTMSPLQRQSLDILQLPIMAIEQRIREEAEQNPAIDEVIGPKIELDAPPINDDAQVAEREAKQNDDDLQIHDTISSSSFNSEDAEERRRYMFESLRQPESLEDHLRSQIRTSALDDNGKVIAETITANLSSTGMLLVTTGEIAEVTDESLERVEEVLSLIQKTFDPPGIAARNAQERLTLQLMATDSESRALAIKIVENYLEDLASGNRDGRIAAALNLPRQEVDKALKLIRGLNPNPVAEFDAPTPQDFIIPELNVTKGKNGEWVVSFDYDTTTHITINENYRSYLESDEIASSDKAYIKERIRSAEVLSHCLEQRCETILKVGDAIVRMQQDFFTYGVSKLKPMTLSDIAEVVGRHETTVGRAVEGKYLRSPRGIFELKYFFSAKIKSSDGSQGSFSNKAVMDSIVNIIKSENVKKPYSDQDIVEILRKDGMDVSRRTIAKYRDALSIPSSSRRKRT